MSKNECATWDKKGEQPVKKAEIAMDEIQKILNDLNQKTKITKKEYQEAQEKIEAIFQESESIEEIIKQKYKERLDEIFKNHQ